MRRSLLVIAATLSITALIASTTLAADLGKNWRVYNVMPGTAMYWDINKLGPDMSFPVQKYLSPTSGSFVVYVLNNYNIDLTGQTLSMGANWTTGTYNTRSTVAEAFVRFEFQDVTSGPYDMNDYWWSTGPNSLDLNAASAGQLRVSLTDPTKWSNLCGRFADDTATGYTDCMTGTTVTVSASDGFTAALKNVKQLGLAFGSSSRYASGIALVGTSGTFTMTSFEVTAP